MFELTVHFKHKMVGIWQRFQRNFELSGTSNYSVRIKHSRPVQGINDWGSMSVDDLYKTQSSIFQLGISANIL